MREILFRLGDRYDQELAAETARNLRTRYPFNDAWIEVIEIAPGRLLLRVVTIDQWSLIGGLRSISRDGNETDLRIGFEERNLLGRAQFVSFDIYKREKHPDYIETAYREPRIMGRPWAIGLAYRSDPHNTLKQVFLARPYYSLAQRMELGIQLEDAVVLQRRLDASGNWVAEWTTREDRVGLSGGLRGGPVHRKIGLIAEYRYQSLRVEDTVSYQTTLPGHDFPVDSTYHLVSLGATVRTQRFIVERRLRGFGYIEDIELGSGLEFSSGRAFLPGFADHYYDQIIGTTLWTGKLGTNIIMAGYSRFYWIKSGKELRRGTLLDMIWYNNALPFVTFVARSHYESDRGGAFQHLVLGGKSGLRGYPTEYAAGDRLHVINMESRFFTGLELLSVKIGAALLADIGRTWQGRDPLTINGYHWSVGAGLRLSLENLLRGEIIRADLVRTEDDTWDVSLGTGHYF
ncbi:MAG: hypothetical protein AB1772_05270 [Candidatus Zixiibacteriota bacterium]